jgi:VCBS repeat-containing protein
MNYKFCLILTSFILPSFLPLSAQAYSYAEAVQLAQEEDGNELYALDDEVSLLKGDALVSGNVTSNDKGFLSATLTSSAVSSNGALVFDSSGAYTYTPYSGSTEIINLQIGQQIVETYSYRITGENGTSATATLTIRIIGNDNAIAYYALNDEVSINVSQLLAVTGNVGDNDTGGQSYSLSTSPIGKHGTLQFQSTGAYSYQLDTVSNSVQSLGPNDILTDSFDYQLIGGGNNETDNAKLIFTILGDVGTSPINVEIENNDRSSLATPVNSGQRIQGQLHTSSDKDWYVLRSTGNEIAHLELCPGGSSCFDETTQSTKKGWIMYVFDRAILNNISTAATFAGDFNNQANGTGEFDTFPLSNIDDETGLRRYFRQHTNHMYINYRTGAFTNDDDASKDALVGIIDPCFDVTNTLDIGIPTISNDGIILSDAELSEKVIILSDEEKAGVYKEYVIAISSSLKGDETAADCGSASIILTEAGPSFLGADIADPTSLVTKTTTDEIIAFNPRTDDQYTISVTGTGINPLASSTVRSASYIESANKTTNTIVIPTMRIDNALFDVVLKQIATVDDKLRFEIASTTILPDELVITSIQPTYNPLNQRVKIPKLTVENSGMSYSVEFIYYPGTDEKGAYLELIGLTVIQ